MSCTDLFEWNYENSISDSDEAEVPYLSNPFNLQWAFGFDPFTPVINLSTANRSLIAYASSHVTVIYDYNSRKMFKLQGHRNCVRMLSADQTGKWLLTADFDSDSSVVIWDTERRIPIFTLFNPHKENGITAASLSPDAKYIITVGNEDVQLVKIWFWTFGRNQPDAEMNLTETSKERVKDIAFDWENPNFLALTTDSRVIFIQIDPKKNLISDWPSILKKPSGLGIFNNTTFVRGTSKVFTGTQNGLAFFKNIPKSQVEKCIHISLTEYRLLIYLYIGFVLVWDKETENVTQENIKMRHIKSIVLQKQNITKVTNCLGMVVAGNSRGEIIFYDNDLEILYACRDRRLDFVTSISFDIPFEGPSVQCERQGANDDGDFMNKSSSAICEQVDEGQQESEVEIASNVTIKIEYPPVPRNLGQKCDEKCSAFRKKFDKFQVPRDATLQSRAFSADKFIVATRSGQIAWVDIPNMKCRLISNYFDSPITAIDVHPQDTYFIAGDENGSLSLFNYASHQMKLKRSSPDLPDLLPILNTELIARRIIHVTYSSIDDNQKSHPSVIKYSPNANVVICALANGVFWVLNPDTFEAVDKIPYRHSESAILDVAFSACSNYMAYYDDSSRVAVFKRHQPSILDKTWNYYDFVGKYRSHQSAVRCILFGLPFSDDNKCPRLLSLGQDKELIEYDLLKSGTYPNPGLVIMETSGAEREQVPFTMAWYPQFGVEKCIVISNSDHKFKLINVDTKEIRATILGSTLDSPIKKMIIHQTEENKAVAHMIFASDRHIGLQLLPLDGNPRKILSAIGHPKKIAWVRLSHCRNVLFTTGRGDRCVLMWQVNYKSVQMTHRLGGTGLVPFHSLIDGGKEGRLFREMQDLFVYAQILEQGQNSMKARRIDDQVSVDQLPNLMRAVGFYPSNYQMRLLTNEVIYKHYARDRTLNNRLTFEEFVQLYVNHRPTFGISMDQLKNAFSKLGGQHGSDDVSLSKQQFLDVLSNDANSSRGDALNMQEMCKYLEYLMYGDQSERFSKISKHKEKNVLELLPQRISYKDFVANVMGLILSKESQAI